MVVSFSDIAEKSVAAALAPFVALISIAQCQWQIIKEATLTAAVASKEVVVAAK